MPLRFRQFLYRVAIVTAVVVLPAWTASYQRHASPVTLALAFILVILAAATLWGRLEAVFASALAAATFDIVYRGQARAGLTSPQYWVALVTFLATAVTVSELSMRAKRRAREAERRRADLERLNSLSRGLLASSDADGAVEVFFRSALSVFESRGAAFYDAGLASTQRRGAESSLIDERDLLRASSSGAAFRAAGGDCVAPIRLAGDVAGAIALRGPWITLSTTEAIASLLSAGLERIRAAEQAAEAEAFRKSQELKSAVLDAVAHDFKTPLTSIKMAVTAMEAPGDTGSTVRTELLNIIHEETDHLSSLVGKAIEVARLETGIVRMDPAPCRVEDLVRAALEELPLSDHGRPVELDIPAAPRVEVDLRLVRQALKQLLDNADKYSPEGAPIRVSARRRDGEMIVSVQDSGPGIPLQEQAMVFEKFYRGANEQRRVPGTGMGLAIAKAIVEAAGGRIWVESTPGAGSVFRCSLPVARE